MAHYEIFFAFGKPGTYVLDHEKNTVKRNVPDKLKELWSKYPVQRIRALAMDANDNYYSYWDIQGGGSRWGYSGGIESNYSTLQSYIDKAAKKSNLGVTFGSSVGHFFSWSNNTSWRSYGGKGDFDWVKEHLNLTTVRCAAYGVGRAQVYLFNDGVTRWCYLGQYPDLEKVLKSAGSRNVIFVAMNPYRGNEYFVVLANQQVHIRASAVVERDVVKVLEEYPSLEVISSTVVKSDKTISTRVGLPKQTRRSEFLQGIARSAVSAATTTILSAAFGACTVM